MSRLRIAWHAVVGGPIGPIGWCGQDGYWWVRPCPHLEMAAGCHWFNASRLFRSGKMEGLDIAHTALAKGEPVPYSESLIQGRGA